MTSALVPALAREALPPLQGRLEPIGIGQGDIAISGLRISPWLNSLVPSDPEARLDLNPRDRMQLRSQLDIATLKVRLTHPFSLRGAIQATGLEVRLDPQRHRSALRRRECPARRPAESRPKGHGRHPPPGRGRAPRRGSSAAPS
ncbi:hypothetical protein THIOKS11040010 [Thiocapsa sp. KS1]|nr:hypothetical protein [Thiocapsa sp. KS1]CRI62917.1 hypothetical protein THIOKS11040010 [Thiocapsa sp. KS1]